MLGIYYCIKFTGVEVFYNSYFGAGTGPIVFTYLNCGGTESSLYGCTYSSYYFGASHSRDAGVRCKITAITGTQNISYNHYFVALCQFPLLLFLQSDPAVLMVMFVW